MTNANMREMIMTEKNFAKEYDMIIIGGGPGGYVAAIRASQLGMKVALVERENLGGICLNWGCIPTKALLRSAEVMHLISHAEEFGISVKGVSFDFKKIIARSRDVSAKLTGGVKHLMKKNKITVIEGEGSLLGGGKVKVGAETYSAKHIIIATGARARVLAGFEPDPKFIWTYREAMTPTEMPKSILVVGSGAIGVEFASFYRAMGAEVTIVEVQPRILPVEDEEISKLAHKAFEKQGIKIITNAKVLEAKKGKKDITATIEVDGKKEKMTVEKIIMAVGIVGNVEKLGLEKTNVIVEKGQIKTNEWSETREKNVYAIGDVAGAPWLAHKASHEGIICVEKIAGVKDVHPMDKSNIPGCTYSHPQIASVGMTEAAAKAAGLKIKVGRFAPAGNGKAIAMGETEGLVKVIFDESTGELLGAHMIGAEVTEMIQGYVIGKQMEATELDFIHTIYPHPTMSEMMHEAVLDAYGRVIHM
jgi:dihydrolipoamide dehydrogenase